MREVEIRCPHCDEPIFIDLDSGEVLAHSAKDEGPKRSLDDVVDRVLAREGKGAEKFDEALESLEAEKERLERAFEEARRKAKEKRDDRPFHPFDDRFD